MPKVNDASQPVPGFFDKPIFTPAKIILTPLTWTLYKVSAVFRSFIGSCVRIGVFSFGEWQRSWIKKNIIEIYSGGFGALFGNSRWSDKRLEKGFEVLTSIGGVRETTPSKDGTKLDSMRITYQNVKATIEQHGGKIVQSFPISSVVKGEITQCKEARKAPSEYVDIIIPQEGGPAWNSFYQNTLQHLKLEKATFTMENGTVVEGFILNHWNEKNPQRPKAGQCVLRCNSPTESYPIGKRDAMRFLFLGLDVLLFDYRGTWKSEGIASEGGYYLDAEALFEKARTTFGYAPKDIWLSGFCEGGAVATHLFKKYHHLGVNLFVQNTFDTMENVLRQQVFPASHIAHLGIDGIKSNDPAIEALVEEDGFDNIGKLESLEGQYGRAIVVNTDTDRTISKDSHPNYVAAAEKVTVKTCPILFQHPDKTQDGHRFDVLSDPVTWKKVVSHIIEKEPQVQKTGFWSFASG